MLEIPESITNAKQIWEKLGGRTVTYVEAAQSPHGFAFYSHKKEEYPALLCGNRLTKVRALGGQIELILDDMHLVFNDGISIRYVFPDDTLPKKHQLFVRFDDDSGFVCTLRMYGAMMIYPQEESDNIYYLQSRDKPSPLTNDFDESYFNKLIEESDQKLSAKAFLATEQRIPGLGNGTLQDILFNAGVHPQRKMRDMDSSDFQALRHSVKETLAEMTQQGGRDTEKDFFGNPGGYETILSNKTKDLPCPQCGGPITRKAFLGGNVYFCSTCQPL